MGGGCATWSRLSVCAGLEGGACLGHLANASGILQADGYKGYAKALRAWT